MIDTEALRKKVIDLAIQGKLTEQLPSDGDAETLYAQILDHKSQQIKEGKIKKDKALPDIAADEIPFEIPDNWKWVRLYEISDTNIGLTYHPENIVDEGTVVLRSNNIQNGAFDYSDLVHVNCEVRKNQYIRKNDILICSRNGSKNLVGKCAIYDGELGDVSFGAFMAILRTSLFKYVYYYLTTDAFRRYFSNDDTKQINQVTQDILKKAIVPLPPLKEQERIVAKLENVLAEIDIIDDLQAKYSNDLAVLKSKIIDAGIQGKLTEQLPEDGDAEDLYAQILNKKGLSLSKVVKGEINTQAMSFSIPQTWKMVEFGEIFDFVDYRGKTPNKIEEGVFLVTASNIKKGFMDYTRKEYISSEEYQTRKSRGITKRGDILFTTEAPMGNAALCDLDECSCGQRVITFQPYHKEGLYPELFMYFILSTPFQKELLDNASGTTAKGIKADRLKKFLIPLPPYAEQERIANRINTILEKLNR